MIEWFKNLFCKHEYVYIDITSYNFFRNNEYSVEKHYQCKKCLKLKKVEI